MITGACGVKSSGFVDDPTIIAGSMARGAAALATGPATLRTVVLTIWPTVGLLSKPSRIVPKNPDERLAFDPTPTLTIERTTTGSKWVPEQRTSS